MRLLSRSLPAVCFSTTLQLPDPSVAVLLFVAVPFVAVLLLVHAPKLQLAPSLVRLLQLPVSLPRRPLLSAFLEPSQRLPAWRLLQVPLFVAAFPQLAPPTNELRFLNFSSELRIRAWPAQVQLFGGRLPPRAEPALLLYALTFLEQVLCLYSATPGLATT